MAGPKRAAYAEESAEVEVLYANLDKMKSLTKKIQSSMSRLETSGRTVEEAIGPIYGNTQRLQTTNSNVDRVISAIDRIREPLDMRSREERILRSSPQTVGLTEYIASMDRTRQALHDLQQSNLRSNQQAISELKGLLVVASQQLEDVFRNVLREGVTPAEPLHYLTKNVDFPRISPNKTSNLRIINSHVATSTAEVAQPGSQSTPTIRSYADVRGQYLASSLQNMASACIATARKPNPEALYKRGDNAIGTYAAAIRGMYIAEYDSICPIFARDDWGKVLLLTCQSSLNTFSATMRDLDRHIRENITKDCFLAYEILQVVSNTSQELESHTGELKTAMADALKPIRETAKSSMTSLLADVRSSSQHLTQLPVDGAAVPLTTEVMTRLQAMTSFLAPVTSVLTSLGDGGWSSTAPPSSSNSLSTMKSFDVGADGRQLFEHYALDTIELLYSCLETRAKMLLKDRALQYVFLGNNVAVMERMIRSSELQPLIPGAQAKIEGLRKQAVKNYTATWNEITKHLLDVQHTNRGPRPPSTGQAVDSTAFVKSLSSKEKDATKDNFRDFNVKFDEMVAKHKSYRMEKEVKAAFGQDVQRLVEPMYARYWDRYHGVDKGKGKYVKYDKSQLNVVLSALS